MNEMHDDLEEIARNIFDDDRLTLTDATAADDVPGWDSLAHVNFMYAVEEKFGVQFSEDEFAGFRDVGGLKRILEAKVAAS